MSYFLAPDSGEIARLEDALLRLCPSRQWEIKTVTFPSTANTDLDIAHTLTPTLPELVRYSIIQASSPQIVYHDTSATRTAWENGIIRLRSTQPGGQVTLLLWAADDILTTTLNPSPSYRFQIGRAWLGAVGAISISDGTTGDGLRLGTTGRNWEIVAHENGTDDYLLFMDATGLTTPLRIHVTGGEYFIEPGSVTQSLTNIYLGHTMEGSSTGRFTGAYFLDCDVTNGYKERGRTTTMGAWIDVPYDSDNFTASAGTWAVSPSSDQITYRYTLVGKTMTVAFVIANTDVSVLCSELRIAIPGGFTAAHRMDTTCNIVNAGGTTEGGQAYVAASGTTINIARWGGASFSATALNNTNVTGQITFEIA
ncbi:MAG TPA: hypothetical protein VEI97_08620 [bacterium]|nr:hypothetical protein [bacterium]